ncbi:MAG: hypothetical protein U0412_10760 [Nitrospira sp.]
MALPTGLNDLAKLTLLASDESYFSSQFPFFNLLQPLPDTPTYNVSPQYDIVPALSFQQDFDRTDNTTGFKVIAYKNVQTNEVIIAFGGTDGINAQDWASNVEHLGWNQWASDNGRNRTAVFNYLASLDPTTKIHFTGQSLGGALAQYATYEYVQAQQLIATQNNTTFDASRITLTTFNALGGQLGLQRNSPGFNATILNGLGASAHFVIDGDLVSRLGGGHVGGPMYQLDYLSTRINPETGQPYFLDAIAGHRIETGFYGNLTPLVTFDEARPLTPTEVSAYYLQMASLQKISGLLGNILNGKDVSPIESIPRMFAGLSAGLAFGDQSELNTLVKAVLKNLADAGTLTPTQYVALNAIRFGAVRPVVGAVYPITVIAAGLVDAAELVLSCLQSAYAAVKQFLGLPETAGPAAPTALPSHTFFEKMKAFFSFIPEVLSANESISSTQLARLNLDLNQYAQVLLDNTSSTWRTDTLAWLRTQATDVDFQPAEIDQLTVAFYNSLSTMPDLTPAELTLLAQERDAFITDTASGFANAMGDFTQKISNVAFNLGQTISSFTDIQLIDQAYAAELSDPRLSSSVKAVIEDAREIVQRAGQTVVIQSGVGGNPFNSQGFNPDGIPPAMVNLKEGQFRALTINLPFEAAVGGQKLTLSTRWALCQYVCTADEWCGTGWSEWHVRSDDPRRAKTTCCRVAVKQDECLSTLTVTAQLVDSSGSTHSSDEEAMIALADTGDLVDNAGPVINYNNGQSTITYDGDAADNAPTLTTAANHIVHGFGNDILNLEASSAAFNHQIFGGDGHDELHGGQRS